MTDPFGTARLREAVLTSWRDSPTRFREDANAEEDLYLGGYRDRLLVELAQNAADAAQAAGRPGILRLSVVDNELRAANSGAPLSAAGVASLASLRASAKLDGVGRFGVGFSAVLTVCDAPRVVSTTGGIVFSAAETRAAIGSAPDGRVPVLRLPWPVRQDEDPLPDGFDTEVRLPLRAGVDPNELLAAIAEQATDLLLSLDGLARIEIGGQVWRRERDIVHAPDASTRWVVVRDSGELPAELTAGLATEARPQWTICWALRVDDDGVPRPFDDDVLHAPTRTDERLSLPARLIATMPIEPSRRRVLPGPSASTVLAEAARCYPRLVELVGAEQRTKLVPLPGFPLSEVDDQLRQLVLAQLRRAAWLPAAATDRVLTPAEAQVLPVPSSDLADVVADVLPGMIDGELAAPAHAAALAALDVTRLRLVDIADAVTGVSRPPEWWRRLYQALEPLLDNDSAAADELGAIPVPLVDGRTMPGPRGALLVDADAELLADLSTVDVKVVHPDAAHPVLERLGARRGGPAELLDTPSLEAAVERSVDDAESGLDIAPLVDLVLRLVSVAGARPWLGALALRDTAGDWRRADELALPDAPLLAVLDEDTPLGVVADRLAKRWPADVLTAIGVLGSFAVVVDDEPTAPDHDLPDEPRWWDGLAEPPARVVAVRDLDLVADTAWPAALRLLAAEPDTWRALRQPGGHTAWWIARHALLAGRGPRDWRLPDAPALAGLYDVVPSLDVDLGVLAAVGVRDALRIETAADAEDLLDRLGDRDRTVQPGTTMRAYAAVAAAVRDGVVDPADVEPPTQIRTVAGAVADAADCVVLDAPWLLAATDPSRVVAAGFALADALAELVDLPLASEVVDGVAVSTGEPVSWSSLGAVVDACDLADLAVPPGGPLVHEQLVVRADGDEHQVPWWIDADGIVHCTDSTEGLARALAWVADAWPARHTIAALLTDPETHLT